MFFFFFVNFPFNQSIEDGKSRRFRFGSSETSAVGDILDIPPHPARDTKLVAVEDLQTSGKGHYISLTWIDRPWNGDDSP